MNGSPPVSGPEEANCGLGGRVGFQECLDDLNLIEYDEAVEYGYGARVGSSAGGTTNSDEVLGNLAGDFVVLDEGSEREGIECCGRIIVLLDLTGCLAVCAGCDEDANDG